MICSAKAVRAITAVMSPRPVIGRSRAKNAIDGIV
jgi:hypothetical protein